MPAYEVVGDTANQNSDWEREQSEDDGIGPLNSCDWFCGESCAAKLNDDNLPSNDDELDTDKEFIALDALEDIKVVIQSPIVVLIEDLHPYECVEYCRLQPVAVIIRSVTKYLFTGEV